MFSFLTRLGRLFVATIVLAGVISIIGVMSTTGILVASHHNAAGSTACTMSAASLGGALTISGSGYAPGASYAVAITWPYGSTGDLLTSANAAGQLSVTTQALWSGTYKASVLNSKGGVMASCSATV
jgi:hypothetical protein